MCFHFFSDPPTALSTPKTRVCTASFSRETSQYSVAVSNCTSHSYIALNNESAKRIQDVLVLKQKMPLLLFLASSKLNVILINFKGLLYECCLLVRFVMDCDLKMKNRKCKVLFEKNI